MFYSRQMQQEKRLSSLLWKLNQQMMIFLALSFHRRNGQKMVIIQMKRIGKHYIQYVSHKQAEREDMVTLTKELDKKLTERQARDSGICPIRDELFSQCFDEIIRQVTISSPERGLLLHRVRAVSYTHLRAHETSLHLVCRLLLEKKKKV
eukprot:TRINITY_DN5733_c0_g1_i4.p1 TRINITY_DN5733_c0_g1~~TRINITY_DN5733_c0_g1_i4.p1  ORF type:complete len:150 (+),score=35.30 TRINITY_DN5733_c0_g1_i4:144-593(+)